PAGAAATPRGDVPRVSFVLFDTSGSMNERLAGGDTKFQAARRQLERLFENFRDGIDRMAIAPFDSQRVAAKIREVELATTQSAIRNQVNALRPNPRGNTAVFSAVREALSVLEPFGRSGAQVSLILFT